MSWLSQEELEKMKKYNESKEHMELYEAAFGEPSEKFMKEKKEKEAIQKSIERHNAKIDKTYLLYRQTVINGSKISYYYPFKGMLKDEIEEALKNPPYSFLNY